MQTQSYSSFCGRACSSQRSVRTKSRVTQVGDDITYFITAHTHMQSRAAFRAYCIHSVRSKLIRSSGVLKDAEYIYNNAIDVSIDMYGTKAAAASIYESMQERSYSTDAWSLNELHPKASEGFSELDIVNFSFTMDLLNFS